MITRRSRVSLLGIFSLLTACRASSEDSAATEGAARAERRLVSQPLFVTSADNRIVDPDFDALATPARGLRWSFFRPTSGPGAGASTTAIVRRPTPRGIATTVEIRSGAVGTAFVGGKGPFVASVWVADAAGRTSPAVEASLLGRPNGGPSRAFSLAPAERVERGGRTWVAYRAVVDEEVVGGGWLQVTATSAPALVAAPELRGGVAGAPPTPGRAPSADEAATVRRATEEDHRREADPM